MHETIIQNFANQFKQHNWSRKDLLMALFENKELKDMYPNEIRRATIIGHIANEVLILNDKNDLCKILAIGDIAYFDDLKVQWQWLVSSSTRNIVPSKLQGYDLGGLGTIELRAKIVDYMGYYYDTSLLPTALEKEIIPSYGGTDSFVTILNTLKLLAKWSRVNFIYPEASFLANVKIAELFLGEANCVKIPKPNPKDFFFSLEQIEELYDSPLLDPLLEGEEVISLPSPSRRRAGDEVWEMDMNIFYITPVGNPTGNQIEQENLYQILTCIHALDPNAIFILDNVYVGLLSNTESHKLFAQIFADLSLMQRIIFTESLSKTLGTTGIRLGWTWTLNQTFSNELKKYTTLTKAGFSKLLDEFTLHLLGNPDVFGFQDRVYEFWSHQRLSFLEHMKSHFSELFDFDSSPSIGDREGIYVLLKIQGNRSKEEIFALTGIVGVGITLSDGNYIRYAFGNTKEF